MLPNPQNGPTKVAKSSIDKAVPIAIPKQLGSPVVDVRGRDCPMLRTRMPEATIDKEDRPSFSEHKIRNDACAKIVLQQYLPQ